jgi:murein DD-endopeptidase MepM/ murein hydrolase activator NlpD
MTSELLVAKSLGSEPPILADGRRAPDRREISLRWLSGTFLTGITSSILMGVALFAALDGRQQLAIPAEAYAKVSVQEAPVENARRGTRLLAPSLTPRPSDRDIIDVSTVVKDGDKDVIRKVPFSHVKIQLAGNYTTQESYPKFDPLTIFATGENPNTAAAALTGAIYGTEVGSEISLKTTDFPSTSLTTPYAGTLSVDEVEESVRTNGSILSDGAVQLAALYYIDPRRFDAQDDDLEFASGLTARIVEQNMTVTSAQQTGDSVPEYADDVIAVRQSASIEATLYNAGYSREQAELVQKALAPDYGDKDLSVGDVLRIGVVQINERADIVRASIYRKSRHLLSAALDDDKRFVKAQEPPYLDAVAAAFENSVQIANTRDLPRVYDGIYRAAFAYGMNQPMINQLVKLLASSVDFQGQLRPTDSLEAFFSVSGPDGKATDASELLYVNAKFGDNVTRFYRFQNAEEGTTDYFDPEGKSIRQFLLRNPVPNGRLTSGFGMRRHPVLRFARMHTGTDWAAPRGTPIISSGNGVVEKAGWSSGYGLQTIIRHPNGYVSSYSHQSAIAKGVKEGARVNQGQVIGFVGSTGLSTGAHLHYELIVNNTKVDAMKVRLPGGKSLSGDALTLFQQERKRIDTLLNLNEKPTQVAARKS